MQHLRKNRRLRMPQGQRKALFKSLLEGLILNGKIETTEVKAKELKNRIDQIINKAKGVNGEGKLSAMRYLEARISSEARAKITGKFLDGFSKRNSGYSRIIKLARRKSDGSKKAVIEFVLD